MVLEFDIIDLGLLHYYFCLQVYQSDHGICISLKKYMLDFLKKLNMLNCKTVSMPMHRSGKLCSNNGTKER